MNYGLYSAATALRVNEYRQDVIANNLANVDTVSFKRDLTVVRSRQTAGAEKGLPASMVLPQLDTMNGPVPGATQTDFSQGKLLQTGNDLDLGLQGDGFFAVQVDGQTRYTRDGRLMRDSEGYLTTAADGYRVLDDRGTPIRLPAGAVGVDSSGTVRCADVTAKLRLVDFADTTALRKAGKNLYAAPAALEEQPSQALVRQRYVEASGVEPMSELVDMISVQRAYDLSAKMIQFSDGMLSHAVNDIARVS